MKPREWFCLAAILVGLFYLGHALLHDAAALAGSGTFLVVLSGGYVGRTLLRKR